jgi:hypothetical protein
MDKTDRAFLRETYSDPSWPLEMIAETLEVDDMRKIFDEARRLGLNRGPRVYTPRFDWERCWRLRQDGMSYDSIGATLGVTGKACWYAVKRMRAMSDEDRQLVWLRYRRVNGA